MPERNGIEGSKVLIEKLAPYQQCKSYILQSQNVEMDSEGNSLIKGPDSYELLALCRSTLQVVQGRLTEDTSPRDAAQSLSAALREPFLQIHQHPISRGSQSFWWLIPKNNNQQNQKEDETPVFAKSIADERNNLFAAAVSLPLLPQVIFPAIGTAKLEAKSRKRTRSLNAPHSNNISMSVNSDANRSKLSRYSESLIENVYGFAYSVECETITRVVRSPVETAQQSKSLNSNNTFETGMQVICSHINSRGKAANTSREKQSDEMAIKAFLKRYTWIAQQRAKDVPAIMKWEEMSEGDRVALEMRHSTAQRSRFSRTRTPN